MSQGSGFSLGSEQPARFVRERKPQTCRAHCRSGTPFTEPAPLKLPLSQPRRCLALSLLLHTMVLLVLVCWPTSWPRHARLEPVTLTFWAPTAPEKPSQPIPGSPSQQPSAPSRRHEPPAVRLSATALAQLRQQIKEQLAREHQAQDRAALQAQRQVQQTDQEHISAYQRASAIINQHVRARRGQGKLTPRTFYGVKIFAKRMIFILDISGSMDIAEAVVQLRNAYLHLTPQEYFTLITYNDKVYVWQERPVAATPANKQAADIWISGLQAQGGTNIYGALARAFEIASHSRVDTFYFLSDGFPTVGKLKDPQRILPAIAHYNHGHHIHIHTIGIGQHDCQFMLRLAEQNQGRYYQR